ncbi:secondary thiamine-phosphate synthase enzyme YjbQ [Celerinatantimonas sp. MCCC 1A17872]|uniref:secondary thiamine-phosphate synthase enzyme YjbQ n=1 Tax=Celerinatantimonas sp. MCCC 1A17872 TaxID=3177514 RepID=UPI0038C59DB7
MWFQTEIQLKPRHRGCHLITSEVIEQLPLHNIKVGLVHLLLQHTSAGLTLNENADPTVRSDFETVMNHLVPEGEAYYQHTLEGDDDMPAHIKSSLFGVSLTLPIGNGRLLLGTWQGIYLGEFRNYGGARRIMATVQGEPD